MSTMADFLRETGLGLTEVEFVDGLRPSVIDPDAARRAPLSASAADYLAANGGIGSTANGGKKASERAVNAWARLVSTSRSVDRVAEVLNVDASRVRHRISESGLYAITVGNRRYLPEWQFSGDSVIPGVRQILAVLPKDVHPLELQGWITTPTEELGLDDEALSPREWLIAGGSVQAVVDLARDIDLF